MDLDIYSWFCDIQNLTDYIKLFAEELNIIIDSKPSFFKTRLTLLVSVKMMPFTAVCSGFGFEIDNRSYVLQFIS